MPKENERPGYIDYLNQFNLWLESNALPVNSQLMYFRLLNVFNRAGWPETVQVDNLRLRMMLDGQAETTVIRARDKLVTAGLLLYEKGKKGAPNRYALSLKHFQNASVSASTSASISTSVSASISASHIYTKTNTKNNINPPLTPQGEPPPAVGRENTGFDPALQEAFEQWLSYKRERREGYKPTGLRNLVAQIQNAAGEFGSGAVVSLIQQCMASGYRGIVFDRLKNKTWTQGPGRDPIPDYKNYNKEWTL